MALFKKLDMDVMNAFDQTTGTFVIKKDTHTTVDKLHQLAGPVAVTRTESRAGDGDSDSEDYSMDSPDSVTGVKRKA
jgi:hypothetical protein